MNYTQAGGYQKYKEQSVSTMTSDEMLILLFEELVKRVTRAKLSLEVGNIEVADRDMVRAKEIVAYLTETLDKQYPIAKDLLKMYEYFSYQLARSIASRRPEALEELLPIVTEMRDTWREAGKLAKQK